MTDTSVELREQLLSGQRDRHSSLVSNQLSTGDFNSTESQQVDVLASTQDLPLSSQSSPVLRIPGWPKRPLSLTQTRTARFISVALDVVLLIFALLFLALALGALAVSGRRIGDESGGLIEEATKLGPTVFPIVFSALIGRALKTIGRFKSETGIEISVGRRITVMLPKATMCEWVMLTYIALNRRSGRSYQPERFLTLSFFSGQPVHFHFQPFSWAFFGQCLQLEARLL